MQKGLLQACALLLLLLPCAAFAGESKLTAGTYTAQDANFGISVSISADGASALVGAYGENSSKGAAYILTKNSDGSWNQPEQLTAKNGSGNDYFGSSVSISADGAYALVGAYGVDSKKGAAYIFTKDSNGSWNQAQKLTPTGGVGAGYFGMSVSISADGAYALVGAGSDDTATGAAYIFKNSNGSWTQTQKLTANSPEQGSCFGYSVSISADGAYALMGAFLEDNGVSSSSSGAAYIFTKDSNGSWSQTKKLTAEVPVLRGYFGWSVSISADGAYALVGAHDGSGTTSGAAYIFTKDSNGSWSQTKKLAPIGGSSGDSFGYSVSISSDGAYALVSAGQHNSGAGAAYIFNNSNGSWNQIAELAADVGSTNDYFGWSVSISADSAYALVGAPWADDNYTYTLDTGSAYVYTIVPDLTTASPTAITSTSATVGGTITSSDPAATAYGVCYGTTAKPTTNCVQADDIDANYTFSIDLDDLNSGTPYYVRAYATNTYGTGYGDDETFSTNKSSDGGGGASVAVGTPLQYALLMFFLAGLGLAYLRRRQR